MFRHKPRTGLLFAIILWTATADCWAGPLYNFTDFDAAVPIGINNDGDVLLPQGVFHSYGPDAGQVTPPSMYGIGPDSFTGGINDRGQIVGSTSAGGTGQAAFVTENGAVDRIPTLPGYQASQGVALLSVAWRS